MKTKHLLLTAAIFLVGLFANTLNAQGFSGPYDPANWVLSNPVGGSVNTSGAPAYIILDGPNAGSGGNLDYSYTFGGCPTTVSFDWSYVHPDCGFDDLYWGLNGVFTFLGDCGSGAGSVGPLSLNPGDVLTFRITSDDGVFGSPDMTISNFVATNPGDVTPPVADMASLPDATGTCSVTLTPPTATDNCAGTINGTTPNMTITTSGTTTVTWTYTDGAGNTSTQTQNVVISPDVVAPTIQCSNDTILSNDENVCGAVFNYTPPMCAFNGNYYDQSIDENVTDNGYFNESSLPQYLADDFLVPDGECWNVSNFTADIWEGPPGAMTSLVVNIHADAGGTPGAIISTQTLTPADWSGTYLGSAFGYDINHYTFNLPSTVNICGGPGGTTYWLEFYDQASPGFAVAWSQTLNTQGYLGVFNTSSPSGPWNPITDFVFAIGGSFPATVSDDCPTCPTITQTSGLPPGSVFPVGTTTNTFTATDGGGNTATCSFTVTVTDDEDPIPNVDSSLVVSYPSTLVPIAIVDNGVIMDSVLASSLPTSLSSGDIGSVCLDIQHSFDGDLIITLVSPQGTQLILSANHGGAEDNYIATCFDMDAATNITTAAPPFVGSFIPEGLGGFDVFNGEDPNGYWKLMVEDVASGDVGSLMNFTMNFDFHWDTILPVAHVECSVPAPTAWDNCTSSITATTSDPTSFTSDGTYLITWTYTDAAGNTFVQTQEVIAHDVTPPVPTVSSIPPISGSCSVTIESVPTATDACTGGPITGTTTDAITYNVAGSYTVTWTYTDGNGNSTTQTQTLIVTDTQDPVPTVPILPNVTGNCSVTVAPPPTATDNCAGTVTGTTTDPLVYNVVGTFFITWTYDDGNGNTFTQNQTVIVNPCLGIEDESGQWSALISPNPGPGIFTISLSEMPTANTEIKLVDALGQVLYSGMMNSQIQQFDFSHLASATYYVLINNGTGQISKPVIIQHQ